MQPRHRNGQFAPGPRAEAAGLGAASLLPAHVREVVDTFLAANPDAALWARWAGTDPDDAETADCDVLSEAFVAHAAAAGVQARLVHVEPPTPQPWYSHHWFAVVETAEGEVAIDFTARQFHNVDDDMDAWTDPTLIEVPEVFAWPGPYPVAGVRFDETPDPRPRWRANG